MKIADFSSSQKREMEDGVIYTSGVGCTNYYASPEMLTLKCSYDGIKADIWAAGVSLY